MATTKAPKSVLVKQKWEEFKITPGQRAFLDQNGVGDGRDVERLREAIELGAKLKISWRKGFYKILEGERKSS